MTDGGRGVESGARREGGWRCARPPQPVCFRSVLTDHPFISAHILVSVVTQREARRAGKDLHRVTRRPRVPKCISGRPDNALRGFFYVCVFV